MAQTYKDIQRITGLSLSTISKYFNGGNIREANREAIEKALEGMDYRVNEYARGLKSHRSRMVGGIIPELNSTFNTAIMADVEGYLRQHGYGFLICDCRLDRDMERDALEFLLGRMVDGIITIPYDKSGGHLKLARDHDIPVVLIDRLADDFQTDAVVVDNQEAARKAAEEFVKAGHRDLAIVCGPEGLYTMKCRMEGFRRTLLDYGLPARPEWMRSVDMTVDGGYQAAKEILMLPARPTALFCANYEVTLGTIIAMNELGVRMPEDISLIGLDNLMLSGVIKPKLTMVVQPMRQIAESAAALMLRRLESDGARQEPPQIIRLPAELLPGQSVAAVSNITNGPFTNGG